MKPENDPEKQQIEDSKKNPRCFEPLYNKYYGMVLKFVYKRMDNLEDCREVTSTVFSKALLNIGKYQDRGFPFSTWLCRIAINEVNQFYRDSAKHRGVSVDDKGLQSLAAETGMEREELYAMLSGALEQLSEEDLQLLELRFFEGRSFAEVGQLLEINENNAKVKTYRVIDKLRKVFKKIEA